MSECMTPNDEKYVRPWPSLEEFMADCDRILNTGSRRTGLTNLYVSPETMEDMKAFASKEVIREERFASSDASGDDSNV